MHYSAFTRTRSLDDRREQPDELRMVAAEEGGIGGGVAPHPEGKNHATFYIAVPDLDAALTIFNCWGCRGA